MWFLPFFPPVQRVCNNFTDLLQPTRVSFVGHNSWDAWGWQGSGTRGRVRVGAARWESTGGIAQAQGTWLWVIRIDCIHLKIIPRKSSLWAGFPSGKTCWDPAEGPRRELQADTQTTIRGYTGQPQHLMVLIHSLCPSAEQQGNSLCKFGNKWQKMIIWSPAECMVPFLPIALRQRPEADGRL